MRLAERLRSGSMGILPWGDTGVYMYMWAAQFALSMVYWYRCNSLVQVGLSIICHLACFWYMQVTRQHLQTLSNSELEHDVGAPNRVLYLLLFITIMSWPFLLQERLYPGIVLVLLRGKAQAYIWWHSPINVHRSTTVQHDIRNERCCVHHTFLIKLHTAGDPGSASRKLWGGAK